MESLDIKIWKYSTAFSILTLIIILTVITWNRTTHYAAFADPIHMLTERAAPFTCCKKSYYKLQQAHTLSPHPLTFIKTVSAIIPDDIHLTSYSYEAKKSIVLKGNAQQQRTLLAFVQALQQIPHCQQFTLTDTQHLPPRELSFTITLPLSEHYGTH